MRKRHTELSIGAGRHGGREPYLVLGKKAGFQDGMKLKMLCCLGGGAEAGGGGGSREGGGGGSGEIAHSIKRLSCTHEDLSLDPRHSHL